jgi:hypothetical protein
MVVIFDGIDAEKEMQVDISGPMGANRLYINTGVAKIRFDGIGSDWRRESCEFEVGRVLSDHQVIETAATGSLNTISYSKGGAGVLAGWGVDRVTARFDSRNQRVMVKLDLVVKDADASIERVGYRVDVLARYTK